jgi:putative ABC transport system permease protein
VSAVPISDWQLVIAVSLVLAAGAVSALLRLGLLKTLAWATVRTFLQLFLMGWALKYLFAWDNPWLVLGLLVFMIAFAAWTALRRVTGAPKRRYGLAFLSLVPGTFLVTTVVCLLVIRGDPWYSARVVVPIAGMILGNSLNGISLALDRLYGEVRAQAPRIEALLALGAGRWEAVRTEVRVALRAGMTPIINSMMAVGLVFLPGMMVGQILAGSDPLTAVRYQIVIMLMLAAAASIGSLLLVGLHYPKLFTADGALKPELSSSQGEGKNTA